MNGLFVAGTDTDAGKTVITAGLLRLFRDLGERVRAVKPVQTGCGVFGGRAPDVLCYREAAGEGVAEALECYAEPCSPHLAAAMEGRPLAVSALCRRLEAATPPETSLTLVEGAGGLYVPLNDGETMLDLAEALRFPVLLVVGNRLGCLNHALLSLEALCRRGVSVCGLVLKRCAPDPDDALERRILEDNARTLASWGARRGAPLLADLPFFPDIAASWSALAALLRPVAARLREQRSRAEHLSAAALLDFDRRHLWHPYTSALHPLPVREAVSASGVRIRLRDGRELVDGMSSWWCALHGYGHPALTAALRRQAGRMPHVMFGGLTHAPAVELGRRLLPLLPDNLAHLFYADSGSVAVEAALKMAVQYWRARGFPAKTRVLTPRGGYHGDTQGAMAVCDPVNGMHRLFRGVIAEQLFVERPRCRFDAPFDAESLAPMAEALERHGRELAAVILEPVVQGAGGMWFYHPDYLRGLRRLCDAHDVLLIVDEIATGFGRTGRMFASEWADLRPDILCLGKALTGGVMTLAVTAASAAVAEGLEQAGPEQGGGVFMHGPTFMANPLACAVACASLDVLLSSPWRERVAALERGLRAGLEPCGGLPGVRDVRVLGGIGVVEMERPVDMAALQDFFVRRGVWIRPFNRLIYLMPPYPTDAADLALLTGAVADAVRGGADVRCERVAPSQSMFTGSRSR